MGFPGGSDHKESAWNADLGSIPGSERYSGEGNGYPLQYSCLGNPMDRGAFWAIVPRGCRVRHDWACARTHTHTHTHTFSLLYRWEAEVQRGQVTSWLRSHSPNCMEPGTAFRLSLPRATERHVGLTYSCKRPVTHSLFKKTKLKKKKD